MSKADHISGPKIFSVLIPNLESRKRSSNFWSTDQRSEHDKVVALDDEAVSRAEAELWRW